MDFCAMSNLGEWHFSSKQNDESTYGLKGEALAAIRLLADVDIYSRYETSSYFCHKKFRADASTITKLVSDEYPTGTKVVVTNIFRNLPVRMKAINRTSELQAIYQFIRSMSILHHKICWKIIDVSKLNSRSLLNVLPRSSSSKSFGVMHGLGMLSKMEVM